MASVLEIFEREYKALNTGSTELSNAQIIKAESATSIHVNLHNQHLNELLLVPISKLLSRIGQSILVLDLSFNLSFNDCCALHLKKTLKNCLNLNELTIEKTGITDQGGIVIIKTLTNIKSLNVSSNKLTERFTEKLGTIFEEGKLQKLEVLDICNLKMNEKAAISLLEPLVRKSNVEILNFSMNCLKFRSASHLLNLLVRYKNSALKYVDLQYNPISKSLLNEIETELMQKRNYLEKVVEGQANKVLKSHIDYKISIVEEPKSIPSPILNESLSQTPNSHKVGKHVKCSMPIQLIEAPTEMSPNKSEESINKEQSNEDTKDQGILNEAQSNINYESLRIRIMQSKDKANDLHPFYFSFNDMKENRGVRVIPIIKSCPISNVQSKQKLQRAPNAIAEELDEDTLNKDNKTLNQQLHVYSSLVDRSSIEVETEKAIVRSNIQKLLKLYDELEAPHNKFGRSPLEIAKDLINETKNIGKGNKLKERQLSCGRFIRKSFDTRNFTQYNTNESKRSLRMDIGNKKRGIVLGNEEERVYREIIEKNRLVLKRSSLNK